MALSRRELASVRDFCARTSDAYLARQIEVRQHYIGTLERHVELGTAGQYMLDDLARMRETLSIEVAEQTRRAS